MAAWHAWRAREFERMNTGEVARESERDLEVDIEEGRLRERALRYDSILRKRGRRGHGGGRAAGSEAGPVFVTRFLLAESPYILARLPRLSVLCNPPRRVVVAVSQSLFDPVSLSLR